MFCRLLYRRALMKGQDKVVPHIMQNIHGIFNFVVIIHCTKALLIKLYNLLLMVATTTAVFESS